MQILFVEVMANDCNKGLSEIRHGMSGIVFGDQRESECIFYFKD